MVFVWALVWVSVSAPVVMMMVMMMVAKNCVVSGNTFIDQY
jgi:hypothetical protein